MVEKFDLEALKRDYVASDERGDAKFTIDFHDMTIVLERLEQAEQAVKRKQSALDTVARIVETQCEAVVLATDSQDLIGEDLDGDWDTVWGRLSELADAKRTAEQAVQRVRELHERIPVLVNDRWEIDHCKFCYEQDFSSDDAVWPCPTIRALDGAGRG